MEPANRQATLVRWFGFKRLVQELLERRGEKSYTAVSLTTPTNAESIPVLDAPLSVDDAPVITVSKDWTLSVLYEKYSRGKVLLQPTYQREYVWQRRPELRSRLVESLLLDIPIPPVYLAEGPNGQLEVIDGQQRLTSLVRFLANEYSLVRLERMRSLNGKAFRDLSDAQQEKIRDAHIRSVVVETGSNHHLRYEVFERLNRGAMPLNEQELRTVVYRGPFCDMLAEIEQDPTWRKVKGSMVIEPRFREREMILRLFAFTNRLDFYRGNLKPFLNEYMEKHAPQLPEQLAEQAQLFRQTMRNVYTVFGGHSGRLYSVERADRRRHEGGWDSQFSIAALDIQASALTGHTTALVQAAAEQIREAYIFYLLTNPNVRLAVRRASNERNATRTRWLEFKTLVLNILRPCLTFNWKVGILSDK